MEEQERALNEPPAVAAEGEPEGSASEVAVLEVVEEVGFWGATGAVSSPSEATGAVSVPSEGESPPHPRKYVGATRAVSNPLGATGAVSIPSEGESPPYPKGFEGATGAVSDPVGATRAVSVPPEGESPPRPKTLARQGGFRHPAPGTSLRLAPTGEAPIGMERGHFRGEFPEWETTGPRPHEQDHGTPAEARPAGEERVQEVVEEGSWDTERGPPERGARKCFAGKDLPVS